MPWISVGFLTALARHKGVYGIADLWAWTITIVINYNLINNIYSYSTFTLYRKYSYQYIHIHFRWKIQISRVSKVLNSKLVTLQP